jgi:alkanesulfonate monooxygenase SsuD/methylene tetrahydromethanopterin reductase-like flavin-dependent oxidoreductase (luciferase family)
VQYGVALPTGGECGDPRFLVELCERAEAAGWDGLFLEDYVCYQGDPRLATTNTWVALAAIAVRTSRIRLVTCVTPLARRRPWNVAREAAAIDRLSEGRLILGVGLGDTGEALGVADASFTHFGEERDPRRRAEILDEGLEIVAGLLTGEPYSFRGSHFSVDEVAFLPGPVQRPRVPIWIGGGYPNPRPTRRAARWDGSLLYRETHRGPWQNLTPEDVAAIRARAGDRAYDVAVATPKRSDDWEDDREWLRAVAAAGATWHDEWVPPSDRETMRAAVDRGPLRID